MIRFHNLFQHRSGSFNFGSENKQLSVNILRFRDQEINLLLIYAIGGGTR